MSTLVIHRQRLIFQADITTKKKIYETVLKYSVVVVGGGEFAKANFVCNPIIFEGKEPIQNFRLIGQPILG